MDIRCQLSGKIIVAGSIFGDVPFLSLVSMVVSHTVTHDDSNAFWFVTDIDCYKINDISRLPRCSFGWDHVQLLIIVAIHQQ